MEENVVFQYPLGCVLKDCITGFEGVVLGRTEYFTGCKHYGLASRGMKDGKPLDWEWFDESRLTMISRSIPTLQTEMGTGGPCQSTPQC